MNAVWPADTVEMSLIEPDGPGEGAFLTTRNYRAIMEYNCSNFYALSVALLGDAAHPMRPYLAQGAAMALEDAWALGRLLRAQPPGQVDWPGWLAQWAQGRWARNARVQARSRRNGVVFHARGLVRWGRDRAMALLGERLLDQPWLYDGPPDPLAPRGAS